VSAGSAAATFGKNFAINVATGGIGTKAKLASRVGLYALRQGIEIGGDTAFDVGWRDQDFRSSLAINTAGSLIGEAAGRVAIAGARRAIGRGSVDDVLRAGKNAGAPVNAVAHSPSPGVTVRKVGNYFIKEVDQNAGPLARWYGARSLRVQSEALTKLGDMAPSHLLKNGKLITRDAGAYTPGNFWSTWAKGSWRLGTPVNDIRPRNIGANGIIFDPAIDPLFRPFYWTAGGGVVIAGGWGVYELLNGDD
jgi:hypothetical protein